MRSWGDDSWKASRPLCLALALFYSGAATELPFHLMDELVPLFKVAGGGDFPCAGHDCCCDSRTDCQESCCCFPRKIKRDARTTERQGSERVRVSLLSALRCAGFPGPATTLAGGCSLSPHLSPDLDPGAARPGISGHACAIDWRLDSTPVEIPEPVPKVVG